MTTKQKIKNLFEESYQPVGVELRIDEEAGVIYDVRLLGRKSGNGYDYSDKAQDDAVRLYEGLETNADHDKTNPKRERTIVEGTGVVQNVRVKGTGDNRAVHGDYHYLKSHPVAPMIVERAKRFPNRIGFSHNAGGVMSVKGDLVESIPFVRSLDLVRKPATNRGLWESLEEENMDGMADDTGSGDAITDASSDDQIKGAFRQMVIAAFDDDKLDTAATVSKIKDILKAQEKLTAKAESTEPPAGDPPAGDAKPVIESLQLEMQLMRRKEQARDLLEEAKIPATKALLESLSQLDEKGMKGVISHLGVKKGGVEVLPKTKTLQESKKTEEAAKPLDKKALAKQLRG